MPLSLPVIGITTAHRPDTVSFNLLSLPLVSYPCHIIFYRFIFVQLQVSSVSGNDPKFMYRGFLCTLIRLPYPSRHSSVCYCLRRVFTLPDG